MTNSIEWADWVGELEELVEQHDERVTDLPSWYEDWEKGWSPRQAFFEQYPEYREIGEEVYP